MILLAWCGTSAAPPAIKPFCSSCGYDFVGEGCWRYSCLGEPLPPGTIIDQLCNGCGLHPGQDCTPWHPCSLPVPPASTEVPATIVTLPLCTSCGFDSNTDELCKPFACPTVATTLAEPTKTIAQRSNPTTTMAVKTNSIATAAPTTTNPQAASKNDKLISEAQLERAFAAFLQWLSEFWTGLYLWPFSCQY